MLKRIVLIVVALPVSIVLVMLAVANRHPVALVIDPFGGVDSLSVQAPLYIVVFTALILGVLFGGVAVWVKQGRYRSAARRAGREVRRTAAELDAVRKATGTGRDLPALSDRRSAA
ncbi:LapA family protein [Ancylobacter sp. G4_0304]|uniref:LapA family protein n=1 Tax=Ancylobacter sp. G4_0304 TaxID=3114289 RepID=UPI0039C6D80B